MNIWNEHGAFDLDYTTPPPPPNKLGRGYVYLSVCKQNVFQALKC